jgi:hypothetical protein
MDARGSALALATGRIAEPDLPKTCRPGLDVTRFGVVEQFKLQAPQRLFKPECRDPLREDARLNEGEKLRHLYYIGVLVDFSKISNIRRMLGRPYSYLNAFIGSTFEARRAGL